MLLENFGWNDYFQKDFQKKAHHPESFPGRIIKKSKTHYLVITQTGQNQVQLTGKYLHTYQQSSDLPVVGDWVILKAENEFSTPLIYDILSRKSKFSRNTAGENKQEQIIASNIDTIFIVSSLNEEFNLRRIERYLTMIWEGGSNPVILLNKVDLCDDIETRIEEVESIAFGVPIHSISAHTGSRMETIMEYCKQNSTIALLGSSGVGKSTITNFLMNQSIQKTTELSDFKDKGKHTTSSSELFRLPCGALIIDTPGLREIQLWQGGEGLSKLYEDIEELALSCRFSDCTHTTEPGCNVKNALENNLLDEKRFKNYIKLKKEIEFNQQRTETGKKVDSKKRWKSITKAIKDYNKNFKQKI